MRTIREYYHAMNEIAPFSIVGKWDNVGLLLGSNEDIVHKALLALDVTQDVIEEAVEMGANLIISHHPLIFDPLLSISSDSLVYEMIQNKIGLITAHTNLDMTAGGVNDVLAEIIGLHNTRFISPSEHFPEEYGYAAMGELPEPMSSRELALHVKKQIDAAGIRYISSDKAIKKVAYCGGSGGKFIIDAIAAGADAYVTGEIDHHLLLEAKRNNITLILGGHFHTESIVLEPLQKMLQNKLPTAEIIVSQRGTDYVEYI